MLSMKVMSNSSEKEERCNSRHITWFMKSCFPTSHHITTPTTITIIKPSSHVPTTLSSLPNDIVLDFLSRVPSSSLPSISLVCSLWSRLLISPDFIHLRRLRYLLHHTATAITATQYGFLFATLLNNSWNSSKFFLSTCNAISLDDVYNILSHARVVSISHWVYVVGRNAMLRCDTWTSSVTLCRAMIFPRKKFAASAVAGKIYVAGGGSRSTAVEEYDPVSDTWVVVTHAPRRRYGCIGASVDGVFYIIGGLRIGSEQNELSRAASGAEAHAAYASSMDLFDIEGRVWLRSRVVPGGGCVVAACAAAGRVYALTSHAVELSFWSFNARRKCSGRGGGAFGEWCRIKSPPLPALVRVDTRLRFSCVGMGEKVVLIQVGGCGGEVRGSKEGYVLVYDCTTGEWDRGADLPEAFRRAAYVGVEC
ncbi:putative F-box domain, kelch-type beta propeller [Lupinus albus]|uniref:Putative F-box domain, kelch-type beta propeller n=1 Tax=Lupinus albus TaxID=3870 RepID=A0A6A4QBG0_LUPAL|nr:putative F-box domain, kelch-type beta propeller [Lupinus albus]